MCLTMKKQEEDVNLNPPWLGSILRANFFEPCKAHKHFVSTRFCTHCLGDSLCINCSSEAESESESESEDANHPHQNHNFITACTYLSYTMIRAISITDPIVGLAFSDLQSYEINSESSDSEPAFLVYQLPKEKRQSISKCKSAASCITCCQGLSEPSFKFCSIECKAKSIDGHKDGHKEAEEINLSVHPSIYGLRKRRVSPQRISPLS